MSNRTTKMVGAALAPMTAAQVAGDVQNTVTAAGVSQLTAQVVYGDNVIVTTCALGAGVLAFSGPGYGPGDTQDVFNQGANPLTVYPPINAAFNGLPAGTGLTVFPGQSVSLRAVTALIIEPSWSGFANPVINLTATGAAQGTALQLTNMMNWVGTAAVGTGVVLPTVSGLVYVFNGGANALAIYPPVGGTINGGAVNTPISLPSLKGALLVVNGINSFTVAGI